MTQKLPTYSLHKASGNARAWIGGRNYYLGKYGTPESRLKYAELLRKHVTGELIDPVATQGDDDSGPTVHEICATYILFAQTYYRKNGVETAEVDCIRSAMRPLRELFGDSPAKDFESVALRLVRQKMIETKTEKTGKPWCRDYINKAVSRIVRIFRHAAKHKLIPAATLTDLELVEPLEAGRTTAEDYKPRSEVSQPTIEAIKAIVDDQTKDMMDLCILTGARGGELVGLTGSMIDRTGDIWFAKLDDHKMSHKGRIRVLVFGPRSIAILKRHLPSDDADRLFPITRRTFSDRIKRASVTLGLSPITGHWLRHTAATRVRRTHGLDQAQGLLGHSSSVTTERYAGLDLSKAIQLARECG
jgi:integrase